VWQRFFFSKKNENSIAIHFEVFRVKIKNLCIFTALKGEIKKKITHVIVKSIYRSSQNLQLNASLNNIQEMSSEFNIVG